MKYLILVISYLPALQLLIAFLKIIKAKPVLENLGKLNTGSFIVKNLRLVGIVEALIVTLFLIPATMHIGFFLLLSWFGGAIMIHVASEDKPIPPILFLCVALLSAYLRDPSLFGY